MRSRTRLRVTLPGGVGEVEAAVRRFSEHGSDGMTSSRWGVEFVNLTARQHALIARLVFTQARVAGAGEPRAV